MEVTAEEVQRCVTKLGLDTKKQEWVPRTPFLYALKGAVMVFIFLVSSTLGMVFLHLTGMLTFKSFLPSLWDRWLGFTSHTWFGLYVHVFEKLSFMKLRVSGDTVQKKDFGLVICNHPSEADWLFFWCITNRWHSMSTTRVVLKDIMMLIPGAGWAMDILHFLFLSRNWTQDRDQIAFSCSYYVTDKRPALLHLFPEGTDYSPAKHIRGVKYALQHNLPVYRNLLTPRMKGFLAVVRGLRPRLDAIYDYTLGYEGNKTPTLWSVWTGWAPQRVHFHIRRFPVADIPQEKEALAKWCYDVYQTKDELLDYFKQNGRFPAEENPNWTRPVGTLFGFIIWIPFLFLMIFAFARSTLFFWYSVLGMLFLFVCQFSKPLRIWRNLAPAPGFYKMYKQKLQ